MGNVPTTNLNAYYATTTPGNTIQSGPIDPALQDIVQTVNDNFALFSNFINPLSGELLIPDQTIVTRHLRNLAVTNPKLAALAVTADKIADGSITLTKLADLVVTAAKIANLTITEGKMANGSVSRRMILPGVVGANEIDPTILNPISDATINVRLNQIDEQLADIALNPRNYGADPTGTNDSYAAIQEAIDYASVVGGVIMLPPGVFKVSAMLDLKSFCSITGAGRGATILKPTFTSGAVIGSSTSTKQRPNISDLSIIADTYQKDLIGISFRYLQYADVQNTEVQNCGIGYDLDGTNGCYYNRIDNARTISCAWGVRTKHQTGQIPRANANEVRNVTIISPIIGILHSSGNTNIFDNIRVESLESFNPTPTVDPDGITVAPSDRWVLKITSGESSWFSRFRSEFNGNLVSLGATYGHFLSEFFCIYNGSSGAYIGLSETPTNAYQTNNFTDVQLGFSTPAIGLTYYNRRSRLGQMLQFPPQIQMTPRDTSGAPATGPQGYIRMDSNGNLWVATSTDTFRQIFYDATAAYNVRGPLRYIKGTTSVGAITVTAGGYQSISVSMSGLTANDNCNVSVSVQIPDGLIVSPPFVNAATFNVTIRIHNPTASDIGIPAATWTAAYSRP